MGEFRDRLIAEGCYNYEWDITDRNQQITYMKTTGEIREESEKVYAKACTPLTEKECGSQTTERRIENPLLQDMSDTFTACFETATRKNHDYGGSNNDPFANFRNSTIAGVSVERGILVRLMDKMSRISTLLDKEAMVKDEAVDDTIDDAINYLAILKSYRKQNK
jgi:hypothetical protein